MTERLLIKEIKLKKVTPLYGSKDTPIALSFGDNNSGPISEEALDFLRLQTREDWDKIKNDMTSIEDEIPVKDLLALRLDQIDRLEQSLELKDVELAHVKKTTESQDIQNNWRIQNLQTENSAFRKNLRSKSTLIKRLSWFAWLSLASFIGFCSYTFLVK